VENGIVFHYSTRAVVLNYCMEARSIFCYLNIQLLITLLVW
jgi:hypothetical protein